MFRKLYKKIIGKKLKNYSKEINGVRLAHQGQIDGNVEIGFGTYINSGFRIVSGTESKVVIGKYCAIGRNFSAASRTHDLFRPTADEDNKTHKIKEKSILIGNYVWIGDNVFVKEGLKVDDYAVLGANSVIVQDVKKFEIVAGNPAKHIKFNTQHYRYINGQNEQ